MKQTIKELLKIAKASLAHIAERPLYEAEILLCHAISKERAYVHAHSEQEIDGTLFSSFVARRVDGEPIEYITQNASFYGLSLFVKAGVLIPRPESELLVDEALKSINEFKQPPKIAEIGVGSGALSITLALKTGLEIIATDICDTPLEVTKINMQKHLVDKKISLVKTNLLDGIETNFDIIVSNPPYIANSYVLPKPVAFEPKEALFSGSDGMDAIRAIIELGFARNVKYVICEMGYDQKELVEKAINNRASVTFYKDYAGFWRGFVISPST